jgi:hypothetical protein
MKTHPTATAESARGIGGRLDTERTNFYLIVVPVPYCVGLLPCLTLTGRADCRGH